MCVCVRERVLIHLELNFQKKNLRSLIPNKLTMKRSNLKFPTNRSPIKSVERPEMTFSTKSIRSKHFANPCGILRTRSVLYREFRGSVWRLSPRFPARFAGIRRASGTSRPHCLVSIIHRGSLEKVLDERQRIVPAGGTILRLDACVTGTDSSKKIARLGERSTRLDDP